MVVGLRPERRSATRASTGTERPCRFCGAPLTRTFADLGVSPLANSNVRPEERHRAEPFYPLRAWTCDACLLVQLEAFETPEAIFSDYVYFSSVAESWVEHARRYTEGMIPRLGLDGGSLVVELASNDGYLLQHFVEAGVPVLGVEPAANVARAAEEQGVPTRVRFFGRTLADEMVEAGERADLVVANNVLAHVPDLNDFVAGIGRILKPRGVVTVEFPHLLNLIENNQFDTIYHEHFSYFSFLVARRVFAHHGMTLFDVEELPTHGGSLRIHGRPADDDTRPVTPRVEELLERERTAGLDRPEGYEGFEERVRSTKRKLLSFLVRAKEEGKSVVGYGAPAKGNTLLNYCGIRTDFLDYTVDRSPHKQGLLLPGTRIPIHPPERLRETRPDYVLILPWNLRDEIVGGHGYVREWGGRFVVPIPEVRVLE